MSWTRIHLDSHRGIANREMKTNHRSIALVFKGGGWLKVVTSRRRMTPLLLRLHSLFNATNWNFGRFPRRGRSLASIPLLFK